MTLFLPFWRNEQLEILLARESAYKTSNRAAVLLLKTTVVFLALI